MNQFVLTHKNAIELRLFPHIIEIGAIKNTAIRLNGFPPIDPSGLKIYYIQEGRFKWTINKKLYTVFPGDAILLLPGTKFESENNVLEIGSFFWVQIAIGQNAKGEFQTGQWSNLSREENQSVGKTLQMIHTPVFPNSPEFGNIFKGIQSELFSHEVGYQARINHLLDELLILLARRVTKISNPGRDFPTTFMKLEEELRKNLSHQWTVEEMATMVGLGSTLFNEKVKSYSGFSPINYLINIRISEAIKLLKKPGISLTDIAFDTGFYSSQHFSSTFKKLTGYSPSQFRKNNLRTK